MIKKIPKNLKGRDFVVGDIHGMFNKLTQCLAKVEFNPSKDRLFCVGDLCDRGAYSHEILDWASKPWFYSVKGNHEQILIAYAMGFLPEEDLLAMSAGWFLTYPEDKKKTLIKIYSEYPIVMEVATSQGKVGMVHACCPHADWSQLQNAFNSAHKQKFIQEALWSTTAHLFEDTVFNIDYVFVGHIVHKRPTLKGNVWYLDTGCGYPHGVLTIMNIETFKIACA